MANYTKKYLKNFESELKEFLEKSGYTIYSDKGSFKAGKCRVHSDKRIVINKYTPLESRVNFLVETARKLDLSNKYIKPALREKVNDWEI